MMPIELLRGLAFPDAMAQGSTSCGKPARIAHHPGATPPVCQAFKKCHFRLASYYRSDLPGPDVATPPCVALTGSWLHVRSLCVLVSEQKRLEVKLARARSLTAPHPLSCEDASCFKRALIHSHAPMLNSQVLNH